MYIFLLWNLFLAAVPLGIALLAEYYKIHTKHTLVFIGSVGAWLVFFPNAPYILTDVIHLNASYTLAHKLFWYDTALVLSFAILGLAVGLQSLRIMHQQVAKRWGTILGWLFALGSMFGAGFGIYLGRILRYNSWDIITNPFSLAYDIAHRLLFPLDHPRTYGITLLYGGFLVFAYLIYSVNKTAKN